PRYWSSRPSPCFCARSRSPPTAKSWLACRRSAGAVSVEASFSALASSVARFSSSGARRAWTRWPAHRSFAPSGLRRVPLPRSMTTSGAPRSAAQRSIRFQACRYDMPARRAACVSLPVSSSASSSASSAKSKSRSALPWKRQTGRILTRITVPPSWGYYRSRGYNPHRAMSGSMKIFGFAGWSGSGKTTLIEKLIPRFVGRGLSVSLIKHAHHNFDVDVPGKDSYRHRQAGASEILVTSSRRWVLMHELRGAKEPSFEEQVRRVSPCDLLLVEGFKFAPIPKLEV